MGGEGESWHVLHWSDGCWLTAGCLWPGFTVAEARSNRELQKNRCGVKHCSLIVTPNLVTLCVPGAAVQSGRESSLFRRQQTPGVFLINGTET